MPKALITGIAGQTGSHLADYILLDITGWEVHGITRYRSDLTNINGILDNLHLHDCDLRDAHNVNKIIAKIKPDKVFHLAATSFVRSSWDQAAEVINNNVTSQVNIMEAIREHCPEAVLQLACSSEEYGLVKPEETPIKETNLLRPLSPYGVSKIAQEKLGYQYNQSYELNIVITRTFNHCGPRRGDAFVESSFCKQVAMIEASLQELKQRYTIVIVPHSVQQAARVADHAVFMLQGELIEEGPGGQLFTKPRDPRTEDYVTGRFG